MLLYPFEEQFDLPAASIQVRDRQGRQVEVVGQKDEPLVVLRIEVSDTAEFLGIAFVGIVAVERDNLVALQPG